MKYQRTYHLSFSPEVHSDDKTLDKDTELSFLNTNLIASEKLDGGNCCFDNGKLFARSHAAETDHPSFSMSKALFQSILYSVDFNFERYLLFGENVQAQHSIIYDKLKSPFYLFAAYDKLLEKWVSWSKIEEISKIIGIPLVPVVQIVNFKTIKQFEDWCIAELSKPSLFGSTREGFVFRKENSFNIEDFQSNVAKIVRHNHVQTDDHWSKNWIQNKFIKEGV